MKHFVTYRRQIDAKLDVIENKLNALFERKQVVIVAINEVNRLVREYDLEVERLDRAGEEFLADKLFDEVNKLDNYIEYTLDDKLFEINHKIDAFMEDVKCLRDDICYPNDSHLGFL